MPRRYRRKRPPEGIFNTTIESLSHDGRGVSHIDGKTIFIDGALPGEVVDFEYTDNRRDYATGKTISVINASSMRVSPKCSHYGICGGCSFQHVAPESQITLKQALLFEQFEKIGHLPGVVEWEPLTGPYWNYRGKARLGVKYVTKKERVLIGFREKGSGMVADLRECPVLNEHISHLIPSLAALFDQLTIRAKLPQIELAVGDGQYVLVLRVLEEPSATDIELLRDFADKHAITFQLQRGRPDALTLLDNSEANQLTYHLDQPPVRFQFSATEFTQVNQMINQKMIARVIDELDLQQDDRVLDLFCGLGNFTLPIATSAGHVIGVEGSDSLVSRAYQNAELNEIENIAFYSADLSKPLDDTSPWVNSTYNKVLLDPSRAGAQEVLAYITQWQPELIVYVSCNPSTLARDAGLLVHEYGYKIKKAGVMDMFPHTAHVESVAVFEK